MDFLSSILQRVIHCKNETGPPLRAAEENIPSRCLFYLIYRKPGRNVQLHLIGTTLACDVCAPQLPHFARLTYKFEVRRGVRRASDVETKHLIMHKRIDPMI